jgi:hypothetical protein
VRSFLNCEKGLGKNYGLGKWVHLCGDVKGAVWDVEVSNDEDEAGGHDGCRVVVEVFGKCYRASIG